MTADDVRDLLRTIYLHAETLDKKHVKSLYNMLIAKGVKIPREHCKDAGWILGQMVDCADVLNKQNIKGLYRIAIKYDLAPKCWGCNEPIDDIRDFSWDHVYPHCCGGSDELYNLVPMHKVCNERKGAQIIEMVINIQYTVVVEPQEKLIERKEKRKHKKYRNVEKLKPWQFDKRGKKR